MQNLPKEITSKILKEVSGDEILEKCVVNKQFAQVCSSDPKYNSLWQSKIEEDFQEIYRGQDAFNEYKFLKRLHSRKFYLVTSKNDDNRETRKVGMYDTFGKAVMVAIKVAEEILENMEKKTSYEALRYAAWNRNSIRLDDYWTIDIEEIIPDKLNKIYDERNFFSAREKLYQDLFGTDSKGASTFIPKYKEGRRSIDKSRRPQSKEHQFYEQFDDAMRLSTTYDNHLHFQSFIKHLEKKLKMNFTETQKDILRKYTETLSIIDNMQDKPRVRRNRRDISSDEEDEDESPIGSPLSPRSPIGSPRSPRFIGSPRNNLPLSPGRYRSPIGSPRNVSALSPESPEMYRTPPLPGIESPRNNLPLSPASPEMYRGAPRFIGSPIGSPRNNLPLSPASPEMYRRPPVPRIGSPSTPEMYRTPPLPRIESPRPGDGSSEIPSLTLPSLPGYPSPTFPKLPSLKK